jgi:hypothetical protein
MKNFIRFLIKFWHFRKLTSSVLWSEAEKAVSQVMEHRPVNTIAQTHERTAFCPRCGQIPDGDRRMDEARAILEQWTYGFKRAEVDFALAFHYYVRKNAPIST